MLHSEHIQTYSALPTSNDPTNLNLHSLRLNSSGNSLVYTIMEILDCLEIATDVEILTGDGDVNGVGEVGVEFFGLHSVEEHLFDLVGVWVGRWRHGLSTVIASLQGYKHVIKR